MPTNDSWPSRRTFVTTAVAGGLALTTQVVPVQSQTRSEKMQPTIQVDGGLVTLVNVFPVEPENQKKLIGVLKEGTEGFFSKQPGFISASVLASKDGKRVINYSQWRDVKDIEAFRADSKFGPYIQGVSALAKGEAMLCDVASVTVA